MVWPSLHYKISNTQYLLFYTDEEVLGQTLPLSYPFL